MKKIICPILTAAVLICQAPVMADTPSVYFDGDKMIFDTEPFIEDGRTMVPFRAIFEAADATVMWDADTRTVIAAKSDSGKTTTVVLQIGSTEAFVDGDKVILDKAALIKDDRTFVPLRFVMESLGADVEWDNDNYSVIITTK